MHVTNFHFYSTKNYLYAKPVKGLSCNEVSYCFAFNGQEKDDEVSGAGNTMSAEFWEYDARLGRRWNLDPIYTHFESRYSVNGNNPIYFLDPKGDFKTKAGAFLWNLAHGLRGKIRKDDKSGEYYVNRSRSENGNFVVRTNVFDWNMSSNPKPTGNSPYKLGLDFFSGSEPRNRTFDKNNEFGKIWKDHSHINETRTMIKKNLGNYNFNGGENEYKLGGLKGVGKFVYDWGAVIPTGGAIGNLAVAFTGGYQLTYKITMVDITNRIAIVNYTVHNTSNVRSLTHPPLIGYTKLWDKYIGIPIDNLIGDSGPMSEMKQKMEWREMIKY